jgi:hypothetical protein
MLCFLLLPSPPARISYGAAAIMAGIVRVGDHVVKDRRVSIEGLAARRDEGDAVMRIARWCDVSGVRRCRLATESGEVAAAAAASR